MKIQGGGLKPGGPVPAEFRQGGVPTQSLCIDNPYPRRSMSDSSPYDLRAKYTRFRILVIGRANAGKTTLLQRVCDTTEDPCIYDENDKNLVCVHRPKDGFYF